MSDSAWYVGAMHRQPPETVLVSTPSILRTRNAAVVTLCAAVHSECAEPMMRLLGKGGRASKSTACPDNASKYLSLLAEFHFLHQVVRIEGQPVNDTANCEHSANDGTCRCQKVVPLSRQLLNHYLYRSAVHLSRLFPPHEGQPVDDTANCEHSANDGTCRCQKVVPLSRQLLNHYLYRSAVHLSRLFPPHAQMVPPARLPHFSACLPLVTELLLHARTCMLWVSRRQTCIGLGWNENLAAGMVMSEISLM
jgi:hypothetical protein